MLIMIKEGMSLKQKRGYIGDFGGRQKWRRNDIVYLHYNLKGKSNNKNNTD